MSLAIACAGQLLVHGPVATDTDDASALREFLRGAASFSNLEACVETPGAWPTKTKTLHLATPEAVASLRGLGFGALGHANNHAFDLGPPGLARTRAVVEALGLGFAGSGADAQAAGAPAWLDAEGVRVALVAADLGPQPDIVYAGPGRAGIARLGVRREVEVAGPLFDALRALDRELGDAARAAARAAVGYQAAGLGDALDLFGTPVLRGARVAAHMRVDAGDLDRLAATMAAARRAGAALVAVCLHSHRWDADWTRAPDWLVGLGRDLVERGADMVVGHGAPVLQNLAFHRGRPILMGLGNCVFHTRRGDTYRARGVDVFRGAAVRARFSGGGACERLEVLPLAVGEEAAGGLSPAPARLRGADAGDMLARLTAGLPDADRARVSLAA
ncbi:CapA family protein [Alsobacter sp. SYSU M60028]|uniref:CapA family protein n=1 Tax=Alsobacter ponti TaxID=2962936 RepID=A0ABT1LDR2_9HYPH|nr:CapA family protein [Alsobacter ponti]MCP8939642.1 CapA family protein [Alsobacter ponti]